MIVWFFLTPTSLKNAWWCPHVSVLFWGGNHEEIDLGSPVIILGDISWSWGCPFPMVPWAESSPRPPIFFAITSNQWICVYTYTYVCMYVCMYVCTYMYICVSPWFCGLSHLHILKIQGSRLVAQQSHAVAGGTPCHAGPAQLGSMMGKAAQAPCATQASSLGVSRAIFLRSEEFLWKMMGKQTMVKACESRKRWKSRRWNVSGCVGSMALSLSIDRTLNRQFSSGCLILGDKAGAQLNKNPDTGCSW